VILAQILALLVGATGAAPEVAAQGSDSTASLSAADSAWIDGVLDGSRTDSLVRVRGVRLLDLDTSLQEFVESLLPVKIGERMKESELERRLERHTREMAGRTDLFTSYRAVVGGFDDANERIVVVEGSSRYIGTYNGGNAFAYIGDHNRTLRGDQWGVWAGYNRNGFVWDSYLGRGWYAGATGLFDFTLQDHAPDGGIGRVRTGPRLRRMLSPTWDLTLDAGPWLALDSRKTRLGPDHRAVALVATPGLEWNQEWRKKAGGPGWHLEASVPVGRDLASGDVFAGPSIDAIVRTPDEGALTSVLFLDASGVWSRPEFWPALTRAFTYRKRGESWRLDAAGTGEFQERWRLMRRQAWFTRCDLGALAFVEGFLGREGDDFRKGYSWGPGAWIAFASPVGVDFVLQSGFEGTGYQGTRLVTYKYF